MKEKTMAEVMVRMAEMEDEAHMTDHDDDRPRKNPSYLAGFYRGYLKALHWVLGEDGSMAEFDGLSGCEHPKSFYEKEAAEKVVTGNPAKDDVEKNRIAADKKNRTYRIPAKLAADLWEFEEGILASEMLGCFHAWGEDRLSDKIFLGRMGEYLRLLEKFRGSVLSEMLGRAIYDGRGNDIEWIESPAKPESEDELPF